MKKQYVPKTLAEFLGESNSITLKRKYGMRPTITAGTNAPLRNQVLSFIAESGSVNKRELKQFIMGLKEGGSTPAAANMFIKRNSKYFITENSNGITYFKLSNLGKRLVNQFISIENMNVSESFKNSKRSLSNLTKEELEDDYDPTANNDEITDRYEEDELTADELENNIEADDMDELEDEDSSDEIEFEDDERFNDSYDEKESEHSETDKFEYDEDDEKIQLTYYKDDEDLDDEDLDDEDLDDEDLDDEDLDDEDLDDEELDDELKDELDEEDLGDNNELDDDELSERPEDEYREYDFKDKGRPGIHDMDESAKVTKAQFVTHKLAGKKSPRLGGKLNPKLHNLLADNQDKDDNELKEAYYGSNLMSPEDFEEFVQDLIELNDIDEAKKLLKDLFDQNPEMHTQTGEIVGKDLYKNGLDMFREHYGNFRYTDIEESAKGKMKRIIEGIKTNRKRVNEAEEPDEADELSDDDIENVGNEEEPEDDTATTLDNEEDVEKVEITEFIITVDNVEEAIDELAELGVTAERVPVEPKQEEIPAEIEEPEEPAKGEEESMDEPVEVKESLDEAEEVNPDKDVDLSSSDELGLGDQGEEAAELDNQPEDKETMEPTTEFEENKIKVAAEDWPKLKPWLEGKGVNPAEMFGGDIEMEEVSDEESAEIEDEPAEEISDDDIDFSGVSDEDETKVKPKKESEEKE